MTGTVVSEETGEPVPSCVEYYEDEEGDPTWSTCSATGDFETIPFPPGHAVSLRSTDRWRPRWVPPGWWPIEDVPVVADSEVPVGGTISGQVTSDDGVPAGAKARACYSFFTSCSSVGDAADVDPVTGNYEITGLDSVPVGSRRTVHRTRLRG